MQGDTTLTAIREFDRALRQSCNVVEVDLARKREKMATSPFAFLRATYFLWRVWFAARPDVTDAPKVLSVGDIHAENFGTWRDGEARLVYGVNDFDEVEVLPLDNDIIRLATSLLLADGREIHGEAVIDAVMNGYRQGLADPRPCLPDERDRDIRELVAADDAERRDFWKKFDGDGDVEPSRTVRKLLRDSLPEGASRVIYRSRQAGLGSLGKPRMVAIAKWQGGRVLREAKLFLPTSVVMGGTEIKKAVALAERLYGMPSRSADPQWAIRNGWVIRRLSAGNRKIELGAADKRLQVPLIEAMGREVGSLHAMSGKPGKILKYLDSLPKNHVHTAVEHARNEVERAFITYRDSTEGKRGG